MSEMKIVIAGAAGRMGRMLVQAVTAAPGAVVSAALGRPGSSAIGLDAGTLAGISPLGVRVTDDALSAIAQADALIDFTTPANTVELAALAAQARIVHVIGTTGLSGADIEKLHAAARHAVLVRSGNMSLGVNLLAGLVKRVAATLGEDYDIEVVEMHHRMKVDAPSGTALMLGEAAATGRGIDLATHAQRVRDGHTGARTPGDIGFATLRGGTVVGDHNVIFAGPGERLELAHKAEDRGIFARGAVRAAMWGKGRKPGHYSMADVLGFTDEA
jgi:4-hydroxy-tetrahydrodipicolinate reductase